MSSLLADRFCILWEGGRNRDGYGRSNGKLSHRLAWEKTFGPIPKGLCVLHSCDTPPCINPAHLFLGTQLENLKDRDNKKRTKRIHTAHGPALYAQGLLTRDVARMAGVSRQAAWRAISGRTIPRNKNLRRLLIGLGIASIPTPLPALNMLVEHMAWLGDYARKKTHPAIQELR